jgi:transposase
MPKVGRIASLTFLAAVDDVKRFSSSRRLVGYSGLAPMVRQSGERTEYGAIGRCAVGFAASPESEARRRPRWRSPGKWRDKQMARISKQAPSAKSWRGFSMPGRTQCCLCCGVGPVRPIAADGSGLNLFRYTPPDF